MNRWDRRDSKHKKTMPLHGRTTGSTYQATLRKNVGKK